MLLRQYVQKPGGDTKPIQGIKLEILGWPKSLFSIFHKLLWRKLNKLFGQFSSSFRQQIFIYSSPKEKHYSRYWGSSHEKAFVLMRGGTPGKIFIISGSDEFRKRKNKRVTCLEGNYLSREGSESRVSLG